MSPVTRGAIVFAQTVIKAAKREATLNVVTQALKQPDLNGFSGARIMYVTASRPP